jgi:hypothetical protein
MAIFLNEINNYKCNNRSLHETIIDYLEDITSVLYENTINLEDLLYEEVLQESVNINGNTIVIDKNIGIFGRMYENVKIFFKKIILHIGRIINAVVSKVKSVFTKLFPGDTKFITVEKSKYEYHKICIQYAEEISIAASKIYKSKYEAQVAFDIINKKYESKLEQVEALTGTIEISSTEWNKILEKSKMELNKVKSTIQTLMSKLGNSVNDFKESVKDGAEAIIGSNSVFVRGFNNVVTKLTLSLSKMFINQQANKIVS